MKRSFDAAARGARRPPEDVGGTVVEVGTNPAYEVSVGPGVLADVAGFVGGAGARVAVLADARVAELHAHRLAGLERAPRLDVPPGEGSKSLARLGAVLDFLAEAELDRSSCLVTLGGGVPGDLGGLAASLFKRGIAVVHAPTTLLAMVDASVGGKTAINLAAGKNLAGTFHQPRAVFADTETLATLPEDELRSGFGEVVKAALVEGEPLLALVEESAGALVARDPDALERVVAACVRAKARVVADDPHERGPRRALNLGHTFAHGIERTAGYGAVPHGVAVAAGIGLALAAARALGILADDTLADRTGRLLEALGLPRDLTALRASSGLALPAADVARAMGHDKKGRVGAPELVLPARAGAIELGVPVEPAMLTRLLA
ncbi:MAG: 3-dehydroquinate synthase [Planctomycetota bacterium]|nr:MAG: 3-dehydroquinate synthase [Planctomycetota bacterium]